MNTQSVPSGIDSRELSDEHGADHSTQETYLRAWKYFASFAPGTNCRAWLFRILYRLAVSFRSGGLVGTFSERSVPNHHTTALSSALLVIPVPCTCGQLPGSR